MDANFTITVNNETESFVLAWTNAPDDYDYDVITLHARAVIPEDSILDSRRDQIGAVRYILIPVDSWAMQTTRYRSGLYVAEPLTWQTIRDCNLQSAVWDKLFRNEE